MIKGYVVNKKRLEYLEKTIKLIDIANRIDERLENNDAKEIIDNNTLAALTLLIAESNPKEKSVIIDLVMNFLNTEQYN